ncbi:polygalacturonase-1 non-catalytic subunit beta-like [Tasmannia lanceolata]|uniref:polygalacturonase-1 non-catalytic subunit beta-like n=1 Tax=Tasmannia lanceolata TaxID=3420 RepID=UPI004062AA09
MNYGNTSFPSKSDFGEYGKDAGGNPSARFSQYVGNDTNFKTHTTFSDYLNATGLRQSQFKVEAGKFFRQENLVEGKRIPMPDIRDKMPKRSFLPRILADKFPFSSSRLPELVKMLAADGIEPVVVKTRVGICHLDTTQWSATHAAFVVLGSKPGEIEVCHWIFENDIIWVAR